MSKKKPATQTAEEKTTPPVGDTTPEQTEPTIEKTEIPEETVTQETGEVTASGEGATEPTAQDGGTAPPKEDPAVEEEVKSEDDGPVLNDVPEGLESIAYQLSEYIAAMSPGKAQTGDSLQKNQLRLRSVINAVLLLPDDKFGDGMKFVVAAVRKFRKTVFNEMYVFRGFPQLKIGRGDRQKLETLVSLLLATADSKSPKQVTKVVDMDVVTRYVTDNNQMQKLQSFYGE